MEKLELLKNIQLPQDTFLQNLELSMDDLLIIGIILLLLWENQLDKALMICLLFLLLDIDFDFL